LLLPCPFAEAGLAVFPGNGHTSGGNWVYYTLGAPQRGLEEWDFYFGGIPVLAAAADGGGGLYLQVPPHPPGTVNVCHEYHEPVESGIRCTAATYTYYDAPVIISMTPKEQSFLPDPVVVTFLGGGFSIYPGIEVIFGDQSASDVVFDYERGTLTCTPPPFPQGNRVPLIVDVRIINPGGGETVLPGAYSYGQVLPRITELADSKMPAFRSGKYILIRANRIILGNALVYFDGIPAYAEVFRFEGQSVNNIRCIAPPHAPGKVDVTVVNADGGTYTAKNAFEYTGAASTDFHSSDTDKNFRISVSEILRAIQFFNSDSIHCDAATEDGYAVGLEGDQTCAPHASDYDPQDWKLSLPELLQLIQFYNLYCYEPCTSDRSGYCPPIDYRETRE